jgi:hypothetical protein
MRWDDDNSELAEYDALKDLVLTRLPYAYDDGEDPPNEANAEECVEYAADEIVRLRAENERLRETLQSLVDEKLVCNIRDVDGSYIDVSAWCRVALEKKP